MQSPKQEIAKVVTELTSTSSPYVQESTLLTYFTQNAKFHHPLCRADSREVLLGIYQWYRVLSPVIEGEVKSVTYNEDEQVIFVQVEQKFHLFFSLFKPAPARLLVRLRLRKVNNLYYIESQEDFYHQEDFAALLFPPLVPLITIVLLITGYGCWWLAKIFQTILGVWDPKKSPDGKPGKVFPDIRRSLRKD